MMLTETLPRTAEAMRGAVAALEAKLADLRARRARTLAEDPRLRAEMEETRDRLEVARDRLGIATAQEAAERARQADAEAAAAKERRRLAIEADLAAVEEVCREMARIADETEAAFARLADVQRRIAQRDEVRGPADYSIRSAGYFLGGWAGMASEVIARAIPLSIPLPQNRAVKPQCERADFAAWSRAALADRIVGGVET